MSMTEEEAKEKAEFMIWKKNVPFLYSYVIAKQLLWPSLTVQLYQDTQLSGDREVQKVLLGQNTSDDSEDPNCVSIMETNLPRDRSENDGPVSDTNKGSRGQIVDMQRLVTPKETNRARFMPQNPDVMAAKTDDPEVNVFRCSAHPSDPDTAKGPTPDIVLTGHPQEGGFGLSWSSHNEGLLASASFDGSIAVWDINSGSGKAQNLFSQHVGAVGDVAWNCLEANVFGSVGDDSTLVLWDNRNPGTPTTVVEHAAEDKINCLAFSPFSPHLVAIGAEDNSVSLFDVRQSSNRLHVFEGHEGSVLQVIWSPHNGTAMASASKDKRVMVYDVSRIGNEQSPEEAEDGPPELLFVHGGHLDEVNDICWSPTDPWTLASVGQDNMYQVWKIAEHILDEE